MSDSGTSLSLLVERPDEETHVVDGEKHVELALAHHLPSQDVHETVEPEHAPSAPVCGTGESGGP